MAHRFHLPDELNTFYMVDVKGSFGRPVLPKVGGIYVPSLINFAGEDNLCVSRPVGFQL